MMHRQVVLGLIVLVASTGPVSAQVQRAAGPSPKSTPSASAQGATPDSVPAAKPPAADTPAKQFAKGPQLIALAGPAFTGVRVIEQQQSPAYGDRTGIPVADSVDLIRVPSTIWRPAFAAGLEFGYLWSENWGMGMAVQMVTVTGNNGSASIWPAVTVHVGGEKNQVFAGYMFGSSDEVSFPNGAARFRVGKNTIPDFTIHSGSGFGAFIIGITVGGARIAGGDATKPATPAPKGN